VALALRPVSGYPENKRRTYFEGKACTKLAISSESRLAQK
jgi:hypothetical protein